jgi:hypothetical protein
MNETNNLNDQVAALQRQVFVLLLALVVVSGTLTVYLYRQASILGKDVAVQQQAINNAKQIQPVIISLANQLAVYGRTHPDIAPLLNKYGIGPNGIPVAPKK